MGPGDGSGGGGVQPAATTSAESTSRHAHAACLTAKRCRADPTATTTGEANDISTITCTSSADNCWGRAFMRREHRNGEALRSFERILDLDTHPGHRRARKAVDLRITDGRSVRQYFPAGRTESRHGVSRYPLTARDVFRDADGLDRRPLAEFDVHAGSALPETHEQWRADNAIRLRLAQASKVRQCRRVTIREEAGGGGWDIEQQLRVPSHRLRVELE